MTGGSVAGMTGGSVAGMTGGSVAGMTGGSVAGMTGGSVAGMTGGLPSPHRPVCLNKDSDSPRMLSAQYFSSLVSTRLSILFSVVLSSFSLECPYSPLSSVCVFISPLITCPYQFNRLSMIFLEAYATLVSDDVIPAQYSYDNYIANQTSILIRKNAAKVVL